MYDSGSESDDSGSDSVCNYINIKKRGPCNDESKTCTAYLNMENAQNCDAFPNYKRGSLKYHPDKNMNCEKTADVLFTPLKLSNEHLPPFFKYTV